jgi:ADP-heptose:LPS heptosyltransferase
MPDLNNALPTNPKRILLINPTRYLGNLLIAGKLMQEFAAHCALHGISFKVVVDAAFRELLEPALPAGSLIVYPRRQLRDASLLGKIRTYWQCLRQIRDFDADIAFNIEEDSVSHRLTQLSAARFKLGCSTQRNGRGYHYVVPINFAARPAGQQHRWYSFQEMFATVGLPAALLGSQPAYLQLPRQTLPAALRARLQQLGIDLSKQQVVLHAGATKDYKKWPTAYFAQLCVGLSHRAGLSHCAGLSQPNRQVVFIGAGADQQEINQVLQLLPEPQRLALGTSIINLCNQLSLGELASYFTSVSAIVGNDSGPFHLAAAQGVPGVVIFGPTRVDLWGPLSARTSVIKGEQVCSPDCTRRQCLHQHRCLTSITPEAVLARLQPLCDADTNNAEA